MLSYASRALLERDRKQNIRPPVVEQPQHPAGFAATETQLRGEHRLAALTDKQALARFEKAKAELQTQNPFLARHWKDGSETYDKMIRARVIRALATECMDLMVIDPDFGTKYPWYHQSTTPNLPQ